MSRYGYLLAFQIPLLVIIGYYLGGWWNMLTLGFVFLIEPVFDSIGGLNINNFDSEKEKVEGSENFYRRLLYLWTIVQLSVLIWACFLVGSGSLIHSYEWIGFIFGVGLMTGGIGITVAHELGHKKSSIDRFMSKVLLMTVGYMHFYIEHNQGHHRKVATLEDPATSRKDESFYRFWIRTVFGSYFSAWKIEKSRLKKTNKKVFSIYNQMIWFQVLPVFFILIVPSGFWFYSGIWSWQIPAFLITQGIIAFTLLELVNYVEHYGILRKEIAPGRYERVNPLHSWNASHKLSNYFLFQLQRHSDHHYYASKPYQILKHYDESPQLPAGYPTMIIMALVPPLWFSVMNRKLNEWKDSMESTAAVN
jgi:alkane 1-monooxygenase